MDEFPRGTVTFLATDIQGSTEIWERYPDAMPRALERHEQLLREAVETLSLREIVDVVCEPPPTGHRTTAQERPC